MTETILSAIMVTGLVTIMMMLIECFNVESHGKFLGKLRNSRIGQVLFSAFLGSVPGCMGGFASVSLYTHGMISFGALVAMMIASSGDEAFVMLAMFPEKALWIIITLFVIAVLTGIIVDSFHKEKFESNCSPNFGIHEADECVHKHDTEDGHGHGRHFSWKRVVMFAGTAAFIIALLTGVLEHGEEETAGGINLLSEEWMNIMFAILSLVILAVLVFGSDHFVEEHLWNHIIKRHLPKIFAWTLGVLLFVNIGLRYLDISGWISNNTALMILLATLVGIIPESGPHLLFVTLYASGIIPLPVLIASCISQDGHASLPLLAEDKKAFFKAKAINCAVALMAGFGCMFLSV